MLFDSIKTSDEFIQDRLELWDIFSVIGESFLGKVGLAEKFG